VGGLAEREELGSTPPPIPPRVSCYNRWLSSGRIQENQQPLSHIFLETGLELGWRQMEMVRGGLERGGGVTFNEGLMNGVGG
jgi:hypothetical protein